MSRKTNKKMRKENKIMNSAQKLKSDFMTYYDYLDFYSESYSIIDKTCRENLKKWNEKYATMDFDTTYPNDEL